MSYLKSLGTSVVYVAFFLAVITYLPGLPPNAIFSEYSIKPPSALVGVLAQNDRLNDAEILFKGEIKGPEYFDSYNGQLYTGMHGGYVGKVVGKKILPVVKFGKDCEGLWEEDKCGRPLGLKFDRQGRLYVADAYYGIFKVVVESGKYDKVFDITKPIDGKVPQLANSIDVAKNGDIYWTDSSTEFRLYDGIFATFSDPTGRLIRYNAATGVNEVLLDKLGLANGLKISDDETYVIVAETTKSTIIKYHLKGPKAGKSEILIDGLPGSPDNIHSDGLGNYLVSLIVPADPENPQLSQTLIPHPHLRKMIARLLGLIESPFKLLDDIYPNDIAKKAIHAIGSFETFTFAFPKKVTILRINGDGKILDALHNSDEKISGISSAFVHDGYLWLGSPFNNYLARIPIEKAFPAGEFFKGAKNEPKVYRASPLAEEKPVVTRKVETTTKQKPTTTTAKPTTTTPKPTTTTPKPTTTTAKPTTTTPKPTTTTPKPTTTTPKPTPTTPKPTTTTPKPTTTAKPPTTTAPKPVQDGKPSKPVKIEQVKPASNPRKESGEKERAGEMPKKSVDPKKVVTREETNELPRPVKVADSRESSKSSEKVKTSRQQAAEPAEKSESNKRNVKLGDEM